VKAAVQKQRLQFEVDGEHRRKFKEDDDGAGEGRAREGEEGGGGGEHLAEEGSCRSTSSRGEGNICTATLNDWSAVLRGTNVRS
jgi:hypothetical protein